MDKMQIIDSIAREQMVEHMAMNIAHQGMTADVSDLCQMVYLILLEYDDDKLIDLWENHQMTFFIARIIVNQFRSSNSPFHRTFRKFRLKIDEDLSQNCNGCCSEAMDRYLSERIGGNEG